jgi:DNA-binding MarR family transcriptional regulator
MSRSGRAAARKGFDPARTLAVAARVLERSLDDMTLPQFRILSLVAVSPERAGRIASRAAVSRPSLSGILDGLVKRGWVRRIDVDGDGRGVSLEITDDGRRALDGAVTATNARLEVVLSNLDGDERARAVDGLAALGHALELHLTGDRVDRPVPRAGATG